MKIIVGGAGSVGRSIVGYLSRGNNDIVVVDTNTDRLNEIAREFDIQPVTGSISYPEIQEKIGADKADILIAATDNDEANMVACEVAYSLFNVPKSCKSPFALNLEPVNPGIFDVINLGSWILRFNFGSDEI